MDAPTIFCIFILLILVALAYMQGYNNGYDAAEEDHGIKGEA